MSTIPARVLPPAFARPFVRALPRLLPRLRLRGLVAGSEDLILLSLGLALVAALAAIQHGHIVQRGLVLALLVGLLATNALVGIATSLGARPAVGRAVRTAAALLFVAGVVQSAHDGSELPLNPLYVPIVVLAAANGWRRTAIVGGSAFGLYILPWVGQELPPEVRIRALGLIGITLLLVIGTRRTMDQLRRSQRRMREALLESRRSRRTALGIERVSALLARHGPDQPTLDAVMTFATEELGYRFPSLYVAQGTGLRLVAQRGYEDPLEFIERADGVAGRVLRTGTTAFVPDTSADPDYQAAIAEVRSEICVPLRDRDAVIGIFNVESTADRPLVAHDAVIVTALADRLATAFALSNERAQLAERARVMHDLVSFSARVTRDLDLETVSRAIAETAARLLPADLVALTSRDPVTERYLVRALVGAPDSGIGREIRPGEGMAGRAIESRRIVHAVHHDRDAFPAALRDLDVADAFAVAVGVPLLREDVPIGAITVARIENAPFSALELEVLELVSGQAALAIDNTSRYAEARDAATHDWLTALPNRRAFDGAAARLIERILREDPAERTPLVAVIFDLDHFGALNKERGHQTGDDVLRWFGASLRQAVRATDLVARYGGEEFVVLLVGADQAAGMALGERVRALTAATEVPSGDGKPVRITVSAGVAQLRAEHVSLEDLLRHADVGLAMAKRAARDCVVAA